MRKTEQRVRIGNLKGERFLVKQKHSRLAAACEYCGEFDTAFVGHLMLPGDAGQWQRRKNLVESARIGSSRL